MLNEWMWISQLVINLNTALGHVLLGDERLDIRRPRRRLEIRRTQREGNRLSEFLGRCHERRTFWCSAVCFLLPVPDRRHRYTGTLTEFLQADAGYGVLLCKP